MPAQNKPPKILVIGDLMVDHYYWGSCDRISPEAPVQIVKVKSESSNLGGAGNVIRNLKSLGAEVSVISVIGDCATSSELKDLLESIGVEIKHLVIQRGRIATKKSRVIAGQQQIVRYDKENSTEINKNSEREISTSFESIVQLYDIVLVSDYDKGVITSGLMQRLIRSARKFDKKVIVDPKGSNYSKYRGAFMLTPNRKEASEAIKFEIESDNCLLKAMQHLKDNYDLHTSVITLSEKGIAVLEKELHIYPAVAREVFDVTGAGDTVLASLGYMLACNHTIDNAVNFANLAAGVVVGKVGSATVSFNEVLEYESSLKKSSSRAHIKNSEEIAKISEELKSRGKKVVFTNGCFDILHSGHVAYLESAKGFGDILILGLNSDLSVKSLKGKNRPINNEFDRASVLAALGSVDYVVLFDEDTPIKLIEKIAPDILVKGGDYKDRKIVGHDVAGEVKIVQFTQGKSTTKIIDKIKQGLQRCS